MPSSEVQVVDPQTGGVKGAKLARFDLIPPDVLWALAEHYGHGSKKYADRNWEKGYDWGLSYAAAMRHANQYWAGHDFDAHEADCPEDCVTHTGGLHVIAAAWHFMALAAFQMRGIGTDSRRPAPEITAEVTETFLAAANEGVLRGIMDTQANYNKITEEMTSANDR